MQFVNNFVGGFKRLWSYPFSRSDQSESTFKDLFGSEPLINMSSNNKLDTILDDDVNVRPEDGNEGNAKDALHEEYIKRIQAEADAQSNAQKLVVAQQQFAEFTAERAEIEENLTSAAQKLESLLKQLQLPDGTMPEAVASLISEASKLREDLASAAHESRYTAKQLRDESERFSKRTSDQAQLDQPEASDSDIEMKRARDDTDMDTTSKDGDDNDHVADLPLFTPKLPIVTDNRSNVDEYAHESFRERAKYIPLRLTHDERRCLRLLEGALNVSEYTDKVDILSYRTKTHRIHAQIKDLCAILCGLTVAQDFRRGQKLITDRNFEDLSTFFQECFEIGRRHKVMNPEKMRDTYGKLQYMLMDSVEPEVQELLSFNCVRPLQTVHTLLESAGIANLLDDQLMAVATAEIDAVNRPRAAVQKDIKMKERAREILVRKYKTTSSGVSEDDILRCLYSISDNNSYLKFNRDPIDRVIEYLKKYFDASKYEDGLSLAIQSGAGGARLTHNHQRQYTYVLQSLTLWREIAHEMFKLWFMADTDMLAERNYYKLQNTGQGLQRVQSSPHVGRTMNQILHRCQRRIGSWVGSSVVHLGDSNVPNALMFIDKYTQIPRILNPLVLVLDEVPRLAKDPAIKEYLDSVFGGIEECRKEILCDFFRHAFDGSGAEDGWSAGSCIDGRLTSAWNWCSKVEKKRYYHVFKLSGFTSFDGDFKG